MALPPMELALWGEHFARRPPGADFLSHQILADIYTMLYAVFAGKDAPKVSRIDVAPWLFDPEHVAKYRAAREEHERHVAGTFMRRGYYAALEEMGIRLRGNAKDD